MKSVQPYLNFPGNTEEAFNFYRSVFGGDFRGVYRFRDFGDTGMPVSGPDLDKIAHIALPLGANGLLMGTDTLESLGQTLNQGNNHYIYIELESPEEGERLFGALSEGGAVEMPLGRTEWSELYGICKDRFGVQWMFDFTGNATLEGSATP
jgi:PhnB protein